MIIKAARRPKFAPIHGHLLKFGKAIATFSYLLHFIFENSARPGAGRGVPLWPGPVRARRELEVLRADVPACAAYDRMNRGDGPLLKMDYILPTFTICWTPGKPNT